MKNKVQLITYVDRLSGGGIKDLENLFAGPLKELFGGVHLLPFFYPIDGADAGFDPIDHMVVDPKLGEWSDIKSLSQHIDIMADLIVNHISADSPQFRDFVNKGSKSEYNGFFLTYDVVFPNGATEKDLMEIYRPRHGLPLSYTTFENGEKMLLWTTFTEKQLDIDVNHPMGRKYLHDILSIYAANGINMVRLDAIGYAIKKPGTSCFMIDETIHFIEELGQTAKEKGIELLVEIHSHYQTQIDIASKVDWVYDFALPPLVLHAFFFNTSAYLKKWIKIRPENAITVLDTHDGIGIIDIGPFRNNETYIPGLVPDEELDKMVEIIHWRCNEESRKATGEAASNLDLYQVNTTYLDALGGEPLTYLLARVIQFFIPGVPQIYYTGLLFGRNDMDLLFRTNVGRDINRHYYTPLELDEVFDDPHVKKLCSLIRIRNEHPAFDGIFSVKDSPHNILHLMWQKEEHEASLYMDMKSLDYKLHFTEIGDVLLLDE